MTDNASYFGFARRIVASSLPRVEDTSDLVEVVRVRQLAQHAERQAVDRLRGEGFTWQSIGDALGISKQAAIQRYSRAVTPGSVSRMAS